MNTSEKEKFKFFPYLPFGLKVILVSDMSEDFAWQDFATDLSIFEKGAIWELVGVNNTEDLMIPIGEGYLYGNLYRNGNTWVNLEHGVMPILQPIQNLTAVQPNAGLMEIEKIVKSAVGHSRACDQWMETFIANPCADHNILQQAPYVVFQELLKANYDVFGWIEKGEAVSTNDYPLTEKTAENEVG